MKKFINFYVMLLIIFIVVGISGFSFSKLQNPEQAMEKIALENTPGYATMRTLEEITKALQLDKAIIDIQVTPHAQGDIAKLEMESTSIEVSDKLLQDSYTILLQLAEEIQVEEFTLTWLCNTGQQNQVVLSMSFDKAALNQLPTITYKEIDTIATRFEPSYDGE